MEEARAVYDRLIEVPMFCGIYDAKNGNEHFMYGIATVMEYIAYLVDEDTYEDYNDMLHRNMTASEERAEQTEPKSEIGNSNLKSETQNSNLTFEKRTMRDCYNCKRYESEECVVCKYEPKDTPQTEPKGEYCRE